jgi:hypothetical protein
MYFFLRIKVSKTITEPRQLCEMNPNCPICGDVLGTASATTECGHSYCTRCLLNAVAKNTGTTRSQCALCRSDICDEVESSAAVTLRMRYLAEDIQTNQLIASDLAEELEVANVYVIGLKQDHSRRERRLQRCLTRSRNSIYSLRDEAAQQHKELEELKKSNEHWEHLATRRKLVSQCLIARCGNVKLLTWATLKIQIWLRGYNVRKSASINVHLSAWKRYKQRVDQQRVLSERERILIEYVQIRASRKIQKMWKKNSNSLSIHWKRWTSVVLSQDNDYVATEDYIDELD